MQKAVEHLATRMSAGLALDPGLRKTSITLAAFCRLKEQKMVRRMLVIAPLRVCRTVWRQEGVKWTEFNHLRFSLLHGAKKLERLKEDADIYLINPEGVAWLAKLYFGRSLPFDIVTIDELTKFKNHAAERSKALRPRLKGVARRWGLTGSLAPNGFMDVFGQQLMLDDGAALGKYITHYRDQYFQVDYNGFDYTLMPGAEKRIIARIAPYWLQMSADDYLELPPLVQDVRLLEMEPAARSAYSKMKKDMLAELPEGVVTAANAAATYSKLSQMANGACYITDDLGTQRTVANLHDTKLDALEELVEELNGQPLLVAYEFNHDLERLRARFGAGLPHLGKGTTEKQEADYIARWNRNELPILACHPASAGHGLNLQEGNAAHVCWFSPTWDLELYDQFIRRVRRSGNVAQRIFNHILAVRDTIDELKLTALSDKDTTQSRLLRGLNAEILRDAETQAAGNVAVRKEPTMSAVAKLSRQSDTQPAGEAPRRIVPKGWGKPATAQDDAPAPQTAQPEQRERIATQLTGRAAPPAEAQEADEQPRATSARSAFSQGVQAAAKALEEPEAESADYTKAAMAERELPQSTEAVKAPLPDKTRRNRAATKPAPEAITADSNRPWYPSDAVINARMSILHLVFATTDPPKLEDGLEIAGQLREFVES